jgi:hypothetical protein
MKLNDLSAIIYVGGAEMGVMKDLSVIIYVRRWRRDRVMKDLSVIIYVRRWRRDRVMKDLSVINTWDQVADIE